MPHRSALRLSRACGHAASTRPHRCQLTTTPVRQHRYPTCFHARPLPHDIAITDEASPFALRSTRNRPRRAVRRGAAWRAVRRHQAAAWSRRWLRSRLQCRHRRAVIGCPAASVGPTGSGVRWAVFVVVVIEDVRMLPCRWSVACPRPSSGSAMACRLEVTVSAQIRPGMRCPEACPIVTSIWTPDTGPRGHRTGTRVPDVRHCHRCAWSGRAGPGALSTAGVGPGEYAQFPSVRSWPR